MTNINWGAGKTRIDFTRQARALEILRWYHETLNRLPDDSDPDDFMNRFDRRVRELFEGGD